MRANITKVLRAFDAGRSAKGDSKNTCWTNGATVFSYQMPIAHRWRGVVYCVPYAMGAARSRTTASQVRACHVYFSGRYVESPTLGHDEPLIVSPWSRTHASRARRPARTRSRW